MLEIVALNSGQIQDGRVVNASDCCRPSALKQVTYLAKDITSLDLADVVLAASEISARDPTHTLGQEVERCGRSSLADDDIFGQLLQRLTHRANESQLTLQDWIRLYWLAEKFALLAEDSEEVLSDACLQTWSQIVQESIKLLLEVQTVVT